MWFTGGHSRDPRSDTCPGLPGLTPAPTKSPPWGQSRRTQTWPERAASGFLGCNGVTPAGWGGRHAGIPSAAQGCPGPHAFGKEPRAIPGVKLFAIFKGPIVVVANEIPHLDFPQADFGDIVSVYHHVFQGAGVSQPWGPQDAQQEDEAAGGHGAGTLLPAERLGGGKAERWGQPRRPLPRDGTPAQPRHGWNFCTRVPGAWRRGLASRAPTGITATIPPSRRQRDGKVTATKLHVTRLSFSLFPLFFFWAVPSAKKRVGDIRKQVCAAGVPSRPARSGS